jgi:hypothetical protein
MTHTRVAMCAIRSIPGPWVAADQVGGRARRVFSLPALRQGSRV